MKSQRRQASFKFCTNSKKKTLVWPSIGQDQLTPDHKWNPNGGPQMTYLRKYSDTCTVEGIVKYGGSDLLDCEIPHLCG